jgi:tRNA(fMet)-specific endonuclease VapC
MTRRLILDTGVLITTEHFGAAVHEAIADDDDVAIAAITVAELSAGVALADERHRTHRAEFVARILALIPVVVYDLSVAEAHGRLLAQVHRAGERRGAHDLIIAATAVATRRTIVTTDRAARFNDLPGVDSVVLA